MVHSGTFRVKEVGAAVSAWCDFPTDIKLMLRSMHGVSVESDVAVVPALGSAPMVSCCPPSAESSTPPHAARHVLRGFLVVQRWGGLFASCSRLTSTHTSLVIAWKGDLGLLPRGLR